MAVPKVFQMALSEEVHPDKSSVQRSRVTGRLLVRMPKVKVSSLFDHILLCSPLDLIWRSFLLYVYLNSNSGVNEFR